MMLDQWQQRPDVGMQMGGMGLNAQSESGGSVVSSQVDPFASLESKFQAVAQMQRTSVRPSGSSPPTRSQADNTGTHFSNTSFVATRQQLLRVKVFQNVPVVEPFALPDAAEPPGESERR